MDRFRLLNLFIISGLILFSCRKDLPELQDIDKKSWIEDKNACTNKRASMTEAIRSQKDKLLALDEMEVVQLLGKPDENELYKRNQKFYYYYLSPSQACTTHDSVSKRLVIRFNAMGLAKEITIE